MSEAHDDNWGEVDKRGRTVLLSGFFMAAGITAVHLGRFLTGLENDMANGWRITVTEPFDHLLDDIYNTPNLNVVIGVGFAINAGLACLWLASYWASKAARQNT